MKKKPNLLFPEILICGYPRSGTSLVTELVHIMTGYPKSEGLRYRSDGYFSYNEFHEISALFKTFVEEMYPEDFFQTDQYLNDYMWKEQKKAICNFLESKRCLIFKENNLLSTIAGLRDRFEGRKVIYVERDLADLYRATCKASGNRPDQGYSNFIKEYSKTINKFASSWAWKGALKIEYDMLMNEKMVTIKRIADHLGIYLNSSIVDVCTGYIKTSK